MANPRGLSEPWRRASSLVTLLIVSTVSGFATLWADTVTMKSGVVYRSLGAPDRDNTLVFIWDGVKRIVVRDSKIERITADNAFRTGETFGVDQPLVVHAGAMPKDVVKVQAGEWNGKGRRKFSYLGPKQGKLTTTTMEQAISELNPYRVRYRGINGFWVGYLSTSAVPRPVILSLLARVPRDAQEERERVVRFEIAAGWYREAREEIDSLIRDFPKSELSERAKGARNFVIQAEASQKRAEYEVRLRAHQPREAANLLKVLTDKEVSSELQAEARNLIRQVDDARREDQAQASEIANWGNDLSETARGFWKQPILEVLQAIKDAPAAVRDRFDAVRKAKSKPGLKPQERLALALSGYVAGSEGAVTDLEVAETLWKARDLTRDYLRSKDENVRSDRVVSLNGLEVPGPAERPEIVRKLDTLTRIAEHLLPPLSGERGLGEPGKVTLHRVMDDDNAEPTEYAVHLPPEYNPLYRYPAVVALHDGRGPTAAVNWWAREADRRGYIVIAPEYNLPGQPHDYRYTTSEHASVELALRDARRRYSIDSDRVFVGGQLTGGNMAWDYGLAHPDLFAGVAVVSGLPAKYVPRYLNHHEYLPLYYVVGDLAPASTEVIYGNVLKPKILKAWDITYVEYARRGLEDFPEEVVPIFDWMDKHRREPYRKSFSVSSARESDNRFYGVVIREFAPGRTTAPEAAEVTGQNLNPATFKYSISTTSNLCKIAGTSGVKRLDVWLSPKQFDFTRKFEVRVNRKAIKGQDDLSIETLLEDLRIRGDRQQVYWHKVSVD